jgi:hypothetical protein
LLPPKRVSILARRLKPAGVVTDLENGVADLIEPQPSTDSPSPAQVVTAPRLSAWRSANGPSRDALLRRLLAFADAGAVLLAIVSLALTVYAIAGGGF